MPGITLQGLYTADLGAGHVFTMAPKVCQVLRDAERNRNRAHGLSASVVDGELVLTWRAPTEVTGVTGYRIKRGSDAGTLSVLVADTGSAVTSYTDSTVAAGASYVYSVTHLKGSEAGTESPPLTVRIPTASGPPTISSGGPFTVAEGETAVGTLTATDVDTAADNLAWSIAGGADSSSFALSASGVLAFSAAKDFENPDDADTKGTYEVKVKVSDGENVDTADLTVRLTDVNEAPSANAGEDQEEIEAGSTVTLSGTGTDPDAGDTLTYTWSQTGGTNVTLSTVSAATTTFTAPVGLTASETLIVQAEGHRCWRVVRR